MAAVLALAALSAIGSEPLPVSGSAPERGVNNGAVDRGISPLDISTSGPPVIVSQPVSQAVYHLNEAMFQVVAGGAPPLAYQWQHSGTNIAGATSPILDIPTVQSFDAGPYTVIVSNELGSVASQPAYLVVQGLVPGIVSAFADTNVLCGDSTSFQVKATSPSKTLKIGYQWFFQGVPIDGATNSSLVLTNINSGQAGQYMVSVSNFFGATNVSAMLTVSGVPPGFVSPATAVATQGVAFNFTIQATHSPTSFGAVYLPNGLSIDTASGVISGVPLESGLFGPILSASNSCAFGSSILNLSVVSAAPVLKLPPSVSGTEGVAFSLPLVGTGPNLVFSAVNLPPGLAVDPTGQTISGTPLLGGDYSTMISASNAWGSASALVQFSISNAPVAGLSIGNVSYNYSSPYLLDFTFSLLDDNDPTVGTGIVADPGLLSVTCFEDAQPISPSETGAFVSRTSIKAKVIKVYLVLDFTESIASLNNGDTNHDGVSDAVDNLVSGAIGFVNQQSIDTQIGVEEFHREDQDPTNVIGLTTDKLRVDSAIAGIWTNYVRNFSAGSRCWDAAMAAIQKLGPANRDEQHYLLLVSDGRDESSTSTIGNVVNAAMAANVQVFTVGFGDELDPTFLQLLAGSTQGRYFPALNPGDIARQFAFISKMARGQYSLRWATLKRSATAFMPSFQVTYQGLTANSPTNPYTLGSTNIDTTTDPPTTNITPAVTNFIIGYYHAISNAGPVLAGSLRIVPNAEIQPTGLDLRASYIPRLVRQLRVHYRANWPCSVSLQSTGPGELLDGWSLASTNDGAGGAWLLFSSPSPADLTTSLPFAAFGKLLTFSFEDPIDPSTAFSLLDLDNTIYTNTGGQSFSFENATNFVSFYPVLPHGTPVLWLMYYGFSGDFTNAENLDSDLDGMPNWQEFRANTNPTNSASVFSIANVSRGSDGRYQVQFSTSTNRTYRVEASLDLTTWRSVQDNIAGVNQTVTVVDPAYVPDRQIFYRVRVY
ncbi:MAG TPA: immunoglobulin domain-containing protein [Verrucomicrobiae bacterium]|nr:immunoglobulin domain-containing protein [Verrucomicrobiae bacterium]